MSRSYWLSLYAALGLGLAVPVHAQPKGTGDTHQANPAQGQNKTASKAEPAISPAVQRFIERIASALEAANANESSGQKSKDAADYLQTQKDMATNSGRMVIVAVVDTAITFLGVILVWFTLKAARTSAREAGEAANAAKRQADTAEGVLSKLERPHLFVESPELERETGLRLGRENVLWGGPERPGFVAEYNIVNYGRSPAIITERSGTIFIGEALPRVPEVNQNDVYTDPVVIQDGVTRKGWQAFWRSRLTDEVIEQLRLGRAGGGADENTRPRPFKAYLFVRLKYESVYGKTDEVGAIWEYLIDINVFNPVQIENYTYRKLGP